MTLRESLARHEVLKFLHRWHDDLARQLANPDGWPLGLEDDIRAFKLLTAVLKQDW